MEIFSALLYTFLSIILFLKLLGISNRNSKLPLPPGPWKLPLLGNIHQLSASGSSSSSPHSVLRDLAKKYGPIMHLQFGEVSTVVVSSPETAQEVMKTHDIIFANRHQIIVAKILSYNSTNISFAPYGEYWRQMRKICTIEHLNAKKVQSFRNLRQEETSALIKWVGAAAASNGGGGEKTINLTEKIFSSAFDFSSRSALGKKSKDQEVMIDLIAEGVKFAEGFNVADLFPSVKFFHLISGVKPAIMKLHRQTDSVLQKIINEHKKSYNTERDDADDLVDVLLKYQEGENQEFHLTENNIKAVIMDMISGGSETTATVIDWAMSEMLMNQSILKKAQEEVRQVFGSKGYVDEEDFKDLKYLEAVIKETLRIHPPAPLLVPRENSERCEINGYEIPQKTKVIVNAWAINRDPRYWEDAECFKPERFLVESSPDFRGTNFEFIPFGAGRRVCPGITFGLAFVQLALAKLLYHFDWDLPMGTLPYHSCCSSTSSFCILMEMISVICFLLFLYFLIMILYRSNKNSALKLPPGPKPLPIIGNIHQLLGPPMHRLLRDMAEKYGPLMHLQLGEVSTFVVTSPEVAEAFLKTHDITFANRPQLLCPRVFNDNCNDIVFAPFGEYWRQMRKICVMELLSSKRVHSFCSIRENEVLNLMRSISSNRGSSSSLSTFNLSKELMSFMYGLTAQIAFGKKSKYQEDFISIVLENIKIASGFHIADLYPSVKFIQIISEMSPKIRKNQKRNDLILDNIIDEHKKNREKMQKVTDGEETKEDLVDVLLRVQESGDFGTPLTNNNIKSVIMDIFSAGSETTSTALEWAMSELMKNPEKMKKAQDEVRKIYHGYGSVKESRLNELKYLQAIIKETLRLHPPVPLLIPRESSEKCEINGYEIPAKSRVIVNAWAIGRDSRYWPDDPEKFNPDRFLLDSAVDFDYYQGKDLKYIPFGAGRRMCPGILFGMVSVELILAQLLFHFDWKLPDGLRNEELDMTELFALSVRRKNDLCLTPLPYHHSLLFVQEQSNFC